MRGWSVLALAAVIVASVALDAEDGRPAAAVGVPSSVAAAPQASFCLAGNTPDDLSRMFDGEPGGLVGADYQRAVELPDGRALWLFHDGAVHTAPGVISIVHNLAMLQDGRCFDVLYGGTQAAPTSFALAAETVPFERWFWPLDAEVGADGLLYVFVAEMVERGEEYLTEVEPVGTRVVTFDPVSDAIVGEASPGNASAALYGWSITSDDRWTYLYAQCYRQFGYDVYIFTRAFDRSCSTRVTVGRVPLGQTTAVPEYWDGQRWQGDPARAAPVIRTDGRRINANQIEFAGTSFFSVNKEGDWWGDTIYFSRAEHPGGPFVVYDTIVAPVKCVECNSFFASWVPRAAVDHPPNTFVFGLAHNRWDGTITSLYRPTYDVMPAPPLVAGGGTLELPVEADVGPMVLNLTSVRSDDIGHVIAHPCSAGRPVASSLNHQGGVTTGNLVVVEPDGDGRVCFFSRSTTDIVVDSYGTFGAEDGFVPQSTHTRLADTRDGERLTAGRVLRVAAPAGIDSVVVNLTSVEPDADGYVTAFPCDRDRPIAANVNQRTGLVVGNLAIVRVDAGGGFCVYTHSATDLVVDLMGGFVAGGGFAVEDVPRRLVDTRERSGPVAGGDVLRLPVPSGTGAAVLNVAAVRPSDDGYVTAYDCEDDRPGTSSLNYAAGSVRSNLVLVGATEEICLFTRSTTDLVVDLAGSFPVDGFVPSVDPVRLVDTRVGLGG